MSLVSEALRKARREAEEQGRPGVPRQRFLFSGSGRRDSRLGTGLVLGAIIAFAAAIAGGLVAWWLFGARQNAVPVQSAVAVEAILDADPVVDPEAVGAAAAVPAGQSGPSDDIQLSPADENDAAAARLPDLVGTDPIASQRRGLDGGTDVVESPPGSTVSAAKPGDPREFVGVATIGDVTLTLGYLVYRPTNPFVQINGIDVRVGSIIEGFVVDEITRDQVILHNDEGPVVIRVR